MEVVELLLRFHTQRNSCNHRCVPGCRPYEENAIFPVKSLEPGASNNQVLAGGWPWNTWLQELWGSHRSRQRSQEKEAILQLARRMNQGCVCQAPSSLLIQVQGLPESTGKSDRVQQNIPGSSLPHPLWFLCKAQLQLVSVTHDQEGSAKTCERFIQFHHTSTSVFAKGGSP